MRILLDESLPVELKSDFDDHEVHTVQELGWSGLKNGELLKRCGGRFDVLLTADQNLEYQQNLQTLAIAVVVLVAKTNRIEDIRRLLPHLRRVLSSLQPCSLVRLEP